MNMDAFMFAMPMTPDWTATDFILLFIMWLVMMIAMMTPSVAPLILLFSMVNRQSEQKNPFIKTWYLFAGYYVTWTIFSLLATILQWVLQQVAWLNPDMVITNKILSSIILVAAGIFQFTSLKHRCLSYCRTPIDFIHAKWKPGKTGAFRMGVENGIYCLGCCWALMVLLFVAGIMNLLWIALIASFVLLEKLLPQSKWISYTAGAALVLYGSYNLIHSSTLLFSH